MPFKVRNSAVVARGKKLYMLGGWIDAPSDKVLVYNKVKQNLLAFRNNN